MRFRSRRKKISNKIDSKMTKVVARRLSPREIFSQFVDSSTLHGFNYACENSASFFRRFFWTVFLIAGVVYFFGKLRKGIAEYTAYPFSTLSYTTFVDELTFPAISLCLVNSYDIERLQNSKLQIDTSGRGPMFLKRTVEKNDTMDIAGDEFIERLHDISIQMDEIFLRCEWLARDTQDPKVKKTKCGSFNFTSYFNDQLQLCYTLNPGTKEHMILKIDHFGLLHAFELSIHLRSDAAVPVLPYAGLKVALHHQSQHAKMSDGFLISPGFTTYVRMSQIEKKGLPPPYATNCGEKKLKYHEQYSQKACLLEQLTEHTGEQCGCRAPYMAESFSLKDTQHKQEGCPIECVELSFDYKLTEARYHGVKHGVGEQYQQQQQPQQPQQHQEQQLEPAFSDQVHPEVFDRHKNFARDEIEEKDDIHSSGRLYVRNNLVNVFFFYGEMSHETHEQEGSLDFYQFLGDMGGEIGLMMGASILK